ncbi:RagB/SusD family nutrient uptake outer membrane protein [Pedobacter immunditicola]|uniref:RagB/SusD family nutrient uptake outer membrane protein n=1 Tax=Pedobacter immunditicola TaxID=3133440 RepID=UPI00309AD796
MKNLFKGILAIVIFSQVYACKKGDVLDAKPNTDLNQETVFADSTRTSDFLFGIYSLLSREYSVEKWYDISMSMSDATDEANHRLGDLKQPNGVIITGTLSPGNGTGNHPYRTTYIDAYLKIRQANVFLANVDKSPFSESLKKTTKAEARFLRAWYYHLLVKNWGGIVLLGDELLGPNDVFEKPRASYEEAVDYIVSELDAIEADLIPSQNGQNYGRITSVAVRALKSRVLLYAASPLTNGGNIGKTPAQRLVTGYESYSEQRWKDAADAAKSALDLADANAYGLVVNHVLGNGTPAPGYGFAQQFLLRRNQESILQGMHVRGGNKRLEGRYLPTSTGTATVQSVPTHNLVKAFGTINGKATSGDADWNAAKPYEKRDPRLHYTVIRNGSLWRKTSASTQSPIYTYVGAGSDSYTGDPNTGYWYTGYYNRKFMDSTVNTGSGSFQRVWHLIRYAELVMNYAEASNESGNITVTYNQLKRLRARAGIRAGADGNYGIKPNMSKEEMRDLILNERQVEFAFEGHRYYDVRRTKTAMDNQNATMLAMKITKSTTGAVKPTDTYKYEEVPIAGRTITHVFFEQNYWFPFHQTEMNTNPMLVQNPGY